MKVLVGVFIDDGGDLDGVDLVSSVSGILW